MRNHLITRLLLLLCTVVLLGCGQKGPLYLPDTPVQPPENEDSETPGS